MLGLINLTKIRKIKSWRLSFFKVPINNLSNAFFNSFWLYFIVNDKIVAKSVASAYSSAWSIKLVIKTLIKFDNNFSLFNNSTIALAKFKRCWFDKFKFLNKSIELNNCDNWLLKNS